jgi:anti-anti-sigma regulatory factor
MRGWFPHKKPGPDGPDETPRQVLPECPQLKLLRMEGEVYFGATQHVADILHALRTQPQPQKHLLVMGKSMNFIDLAGAELWEAELAARRAMGGDLYFHRPRPEVIRMWRKTGFTSVLGPEHQFPTSSPPSPPSSTSWTRKFAGAAPRGYSGNAKPRPAPTRPPPETMPQFAANLSWMYTELPMANAFRRRGARRFHGRGNSLALRLGAARTQGHPAAARPAAGAVQRAAGRRGCGQHREGLGLLAKRHGLPAGP